MWQDPGVPTPEGMGTAGMDGCSSDTGGERPPQSQLRKLARSEGKKSPPLGSPLAKQELLGRLGLRWRAGYRGRRAPRTLLLHRVPLPTTLWLGSTDTFL